MENIDSQKVEEVLVVIITAEDIHSMINSLQEKASRTPEFDTIAMEEWEEIRPSLFRFWRFILTGTYYNLKDFPVQLFIPWKKGGRGHCLRLLIRTVSDHFSGLIAEMATSKLCRIVPLLEEQTEGNANLVRLLPSRFIFYPRFDHYDSPLVGVA
jgi:hypothetical protein